MAKEIAPGVTMHSFNKEHIKGQTLEQFLADHAAHTHGIDDQREESVLSEEVLTEVYNHINPQAKQAAADASDAPDVANEPPQQTEGEEAPKGKRK